MSCTQVCRGNRASQSSSPDWAGSHGAPRRSAACDRGVQCYSTQRVYESMGRVWCNRKRCSWQDQELQHQTCRKPKKVKGGDIVKQQNRGKLPVQYEKEEKHVKLQRAFVIDTSSKNDYSSPVCSSQVCKRQKNIKQDKDSDDDEKDVEEDESCPNLDDEITHSLSK